MAFVIQSGETITISETLRDDLYAAGETVLVTAAGTVDGDVAAAARSIAIGGKVNRGGPAARRGGLVGGPLPPTPPAGGGKLQKLCPGRHSPAARPPRRASSHTGPPP